MVGHAKTVRQKKKGIAEFKETWLQRVIDVYWQEQKLSKPKSLEAICKQVEAECLQETIKVVNLSSSTLDRCVKGG